MTENTFDTVFIGGGPGGYVGAIKMAQLGHKVAVVEMRKTLGGTCLNVGCIPSKALLDSSHKYEELMHSFKNHGIHAKDVSVNLSEMMARKDKVVGDLTKGIQGLFTKNKVTYINGFGSIKSQSEVEVKAEDSKTSVLQTKNIIISTGSDIARIPNVEIDEKTIVSSTGALALGKIPSSLIVIGGGYIGLEMGSVWKRLGTKVTVVEFLDRITPSMDSEIAKQLQKSLEQQGMEFKLGNKVLSAENKKDKVILNIESVADGKKEALEAEVVLVAVGRVPYTKDLGLEKVGVKLDERGRVVTDHHFRTNVPNIYAIGDVITGPMLAHKAEEEGVAVAEIIAGQAGHVNYDAIPGVVYTHPEVATVGKTEEELKKAGTEYKIGKFPFLANSRARAVDDTFGLVKILACKKTDKILGAHIIGADAGTMISELVLAMEFSASAEDVARSCHPHPTLNEAVKEACLAAAFGKALNF
ncbi:MAG: dihydrolipoyl dehydrogenase [Alphaproteobacteria bacterium]|nr:dihydrolipoyl dehydrogenase [Alphaproteobacteria bacterium]OJV14055.1 MAG: dihydrolipoyl dehydrogenase [Alphaproteobacteria bacterium 33-17]